LVAAPRDALEADGFHAAALVEPAAATSRINDSSDNASSLGHRAQRCELPGSFSLAQRPACGDRGGARCLELLGDFAFVGVT
jgi:hypothetical protein